MFGLNETAQQHTFDAEITHGPNFINDRDTCSLKSRKSNAWLKSPIVQHPNEAYSIWEGKRWRNLIFKLTSKSWMVTSLTSTKCHPLKYKRRSPSYGKVRLWSEQKGGLLKIQLILRYLHGLSAILSVSARPRSGGSLFWKLYGEFQVKLKRWTATLHKRQDKTNYTSRNTESFKSHFWGFGFRESCTGKQYLWDRIA